MSVSDWFASDYDEARSKFIAAAEAAGAHSTRRVNPAEGPGGIELTTDLAWLGRTMPHACSSPCPGHMAPRDSADRACRSAGFDPVAQPRCRPTRRCSRCTPPIPSASPGCAGRPKTTSTSTGTSSTSTPSPVNAGYEQYRALICLERVVRRDRGLDHEGDRGPHDVTRTDGHAGSHHGRSVRRSERRVLRWSGTELVAEHDRVDRRSSPRTGFGSRSSTITPASAPTATWRAHRRRRARRRALGPGAGMVGRSDSRRRLIEFAPDGHDARSTDAAAIARRVAPVALEFGTQSFDKAECGARGQLAPRPRRARLRAAYIAQAGARSAFYQDADDWKQMIWSRGLDTQPSPSTVSRADPARVDPERANGLARRALLPASTRPSARALRSAKAASSTSNWAIASPPGRLICIAEHVVEIRNLSRQLRLRTDLIGRDQGEQRLDRTRVAGFLERRVTRFLQISARRRASLRRSTMRRRSADCACTSAKVTPPCATRGSETSVSACSSVRPSKLRRTRYPPGTA